jgi:hypothetical protein
MAVVSLFDHGTAPSLSNNDNTDGPLTIGVLWKPDTVGSITSVWMYVGNTNLGGVAGSALIYTGAGWADAPGSELSRTDFTFQGTVGWQEVVLNTPVTAAANTLYLAAIFINSTHYANTTNFFATDYVNGALTALHGTSIGADLGNGRFAVGSTPAYPQSRSSNNSNYWVDVSFDATPPSGGPSGQITTVMTLSDAAPLKNTPVTVTVTPSGGTNYTYSWSVVQGSGTFGNALVSSTTFTPTSLGRQVLRCTVSATEGNGSGYLTLDAAMATVSTSGTLTAGVTDSLGASANLSASKTITRSGAIPRQRRSFYGNRLSFGDPIVNPLGTVEELAENPATYALRTYLQRDCLLTAIRINKAPLATGDHVFAVWQLGDTTPLVTKTVSLTADAGGWLEVTLDAPVPLTASDTVPYLIGFLAASGHIRRVPYGFGSQIVLEYPFYVGANGGGFGQVEGTGYAWGGTLTYPTSWMGHSILIDPVVEWETDDVVYEGGLEYYKRFNAYANINHFPIGIWQAQPESIAGFASVGINTVISLGGDPAAARAAIVATGMDAIPGYELGSSFGQMAVDKTNAAFDARVKGYIIRDEPDMIPPWNTPQELQAWYAQIRRRDPTKMIIFNLGKWPVINKGFAHLPTGASMKEANGYWKEFAHLTDIISCDFYMEDPVNYEGVYGLWCNPRMVKRLHDLSDGTRPVWHYIATTAPPGTEPTPQLVYNSVWASLIGGARGIVYFDHQFTSGQTWITDFAMNNNAPMKAKVTALNSLIQSLSGPLLAAEANLPVSIASSNTTAGPIGGTYGVPIHYTSRVSGGTTYLFTQSIRPGTTTATFTVPAAANKTITVINESRTISADSSGVFTDSFSADYQVHLYQWT